ncbi:hypothetical protein QAD02_010574 [Eretmocerus hayati]|uniref:Uncharacterized protein n=1 Tax=Eretmocerus hayati TaxID=131215 RepID=A0ACC2NV82_9HYME|nr:hypothetical protein QAD02_010574 [Eretmocerus hayati]
MSEQTAVSSPRREHSWLSTYGLQARKILDGGIGEADSKENLIGDELEDCSAQEYEILKDNLLLYNHARLLSQDNHSKEYLVSIMFSHYDQNNDGQLEREELEQLAEREELEQLSKGCSITHMIVYDDADADGKLNINEFYMAFSKLYSKIFKIMRLNLSTVRGNNIFERMDTPKNERRANSNRIRVLKFSSPRLPISPL